MDITITITNEEKKVLESCLGVGKIQPWLQHALDNKIRQTTDVYILEYTEFNPSKMTMEAKLTILSGIELPARDDTP